MVTKADSFRLGDDAKKRLSSWSLLLNVDKTTIIKDAIKQWEESQTEDNKRKIEAILKELQ